MLTKTEAIVLHALKYGETRMIVDMFTKKQGRLSLIVTIPKSAKAKVKKQFFQPLTLLAIETDIRPKAQLQKLSDARLAMPYASIPFEPRKLSISLFLAEFLYYALRSEQRNEPLFDYIVSSMEWLDARPDRYANFHLVFLMRLSRFLGFYPNLEHRINTDKHGEGRPDCKSVRTGWMFDLREGCFTTQVPLHRDFLHPEEAEKIRLMMRMDYPTMHLYRMTHHERNRLLEIALTYYRLHLADFPELRSLPVLQELYG